MFKKQIFKAKQTIITFETYAASFLPVSRSKQPNQVKTAILDPDSNM